MKKPKYLYRYSYCNEREYLEQGYSLFRITKYEITEVTQFSEHKDYYIEDYGHVGEYDIDTKENGFLFGSLQADEYFAEYWSFSESEEIMKWFKEQVIKSYQKNIKHYEKKIEQANKDISEIKI